MDDITDNPPVPIFDRKTFIILRPRAPGECWQCGMNPHDKSFCSDCDGNGIFRPEDMKPIAPVCETCNNRPWDLSRPVGQDISTPKKCPKCGLAEPQYTPRPSEMHYHDFVDCMGCDGRRFVTLSPGERRTCIPCNGQGKVLPAENERLYHFLAEHILQAPPAVESVTQPRLRGPGLVLTAALLKWPFGVVYAAAPHFRYYVEPHLSQTSGKLVNDTADPVRGRRYDVWTQSKHSPFGMTEREPRFRNGIFSDVLNTLAYALNLLDPNDVLRLTDWYEARRTAAQ